MAANCNFTEEQLIKIFKLFHVSNLKRVEIADLFSVAPSTITRILINPKYESILRLVEEEYSPANKEKDAEIIETNIRLAKKAQQLQDTQRIERKSFREFSRVDTMISVMHDEMKSILQENDFHLKTKEHTASVKSKAPVGIVQLSDVHFNELIELENNKYNFNVASKRLHKLIRKAKVHFKAHGMKNVALLLTGDLLNSDRRLDEITNAATNRTRALFLAVDILQQVIFDLNEDFNVTVASVVGNESRVGEHIHHTDFLAGDSYDAAIHNMLTYLFKGSKGVNFIPMDNPIECVVNINGNNILMVHGNLHKGLARNPEPEVEKIKARFAAHGISIQYVICGHIHHALVSDLYARSSGLPGSNAYSERALNLSGRSSQNVFLVYDKLGEIDGVKIDLQIVDDEPEYPFDETLISYNNKNHNKGTYIIQSVII